MIRKAMVPSADGLFECDALELDGLLWLVPDWLQNVEEGWMMPERMIRLTGAVPYQATPGGPFGDYIVNDPIPADVLEGKGAKAGEVQFEVVERPNIRIRTGGVQ
jgi:hypothetical protein